jgi:hypothetical protein
MKTYDTTDLILRWAGPARQTIILKASSMMLLKFGHITIEI